MNKGDIKTQYKFVPSNGQIICQIPEIPNIEIPFPPRIDINEFILKKQKKNKKPKSRPPNKWFFYRTYYTQIFKEHGYHFPMRALSKFISAKWVKESQEVKTYYENLAKEAKILFNQVRSARLARFNQDKVNQNNPEIVYKEPEPSIQIQNVNQNVEIWLDPILCEPTFEELYQQFFVDFNSTDGIIY